MRSRIEGVCATSRRGLVNMSGCIGHALKNPITVSL